MGTVYQNYSSFKSPMFDEGCDRHATTGGLETDSGINRSMTYPTEPYQPGYSLMILRRDPQFCRTSVEVSALLQGVLTQVLLQDI